MKNLINIEIKNSFNKKEDSQKKIEDAFNISTLNNSERNNFEVSSMSAGSITANQFQDDFQIIYKDRNKNGFWRQVFIGVISGTIGTVIGSIVTYFILNVK